MYIYMYIYIYIYICTRKLLQVDSGGSRPCRALLLPEPRPLFAPDPLFGPGPCPDHFPGPAPARARASFQPRSTKREQGEERETKHREDSAPGVGLSLCSYEDCAARSACDFRIALQASRGFLYSSGTLYPSRKGANDGKKCLYKFRKIPFERPYIALYKAL